MPVPAVRALARNAFAGNRFTKPILGLFACCALLGAPIARAEPIGVTVRNESVAATCAETDNVTLSFVSDKVSRFRIIARHPAYTGMLRIDRTEPDFETCDFSADPVVPATAPAPAGTPPTAIPAPKRITIYETPDLWLTGFIFPSFWRAATVPFRVGTEATQGLHMVQLWVRGKDQQPEEVLVVYPPDGYWRARPLSPAHLASTAYGSSFLLGPVEQAERPLVRLKEIGFAPQTRTFTLSFADGGKARLKIADVDRDALTLEAEFDGTAPRTFGRFALHVCDRGQCGCGPRLLADAGEDRGARHHRRGPGAELHRCRQRRHAVGGAPRALPPQHQRAGLRLRRLRQPLRNLRRRRAPPPPPVRHWRRW